MATIEVHGITKHFGDVHAVEDLSFDVERGHVVGFLGPNGAGKTTTLRMVLGLVNPTAGAATIDGRAYEELDDPARPAGARLDGGMLHPGRTGRNHLRAIAKSAGIDEGRASELLELVALTDAADRRAGGYSMGMRQRLGLATALLGDPSVLVLDEPANGLDPQGIRWLRDLLRGAAAEGRTVLVSSHVLAEVEQTVDDVVVIHRGRLVKEGPVASLVSGRGVRVRTPQTAELTAALQADGAEVDDQSGDLLIVRGKTPAQVGDIAWRAGVALHELAEDTATLEEVFFTLTEDELVAVADERVAV